MCHIEVEYKLIGNKKERRYYSAYAIDDNKVMWAGVEAGDTGTQEEAIKNLARIFKEKCPGLKLNKKDIRPLDW